MIICKTCGFPSEDCICAIDNFLVFEDLSEKIIEELNNNGTNKDEFDNSTDFDFNESENFDF